MSVRNLTDLVHQFSSLSAPISKSHANAILSKVQSNIANLYTSMEDTSPSTLTEQDLLVFESLFASINELKCPTRTTRASFIELQNMQSFLNKALSPRDQKPATQKVRFSNTLLIGEALPNYGKRLLCTPFAVCKQLEATSEIEDKDHMKEQLDILEIEIGQLLDGMNQSSHATTPLENPAPNDPLSEYMYLSEREETLYTWVADQGQMIENSFSTLWAVANYQSETTSN